MINNNDLKELNNSELREIFGGGFWADLKAGFEKYWEKTVDFVKDLLGVE